MQSNTFYITTAINYTNGSPHVGHAYEAIAADVLARYHRILGDDVFFTTGTDEHGQKVAESAAAQNLTPIQLCDKYVNEFQSLNKRLNISDDFYVRTTLPAHHTTSQWLWKKAAEKGDIYLGAYEGWYNVREEKFVTETEAQKTDYKDPSSGKPLTKTKESSYFFKMSKYHDALLKHIEDNPGFIQPEARKAEILERLKEPLLDLSVSRTTFDWGIPVPAVEGQETPADEKHIMYVWFDALTNYLTSVQYAESGDLSRFWPCNVHVIGKDISWFHCVIWPCILMSCDIALPKVVLCHGFVNDKDGRKMSKSIGNVVEPNELLDKYPADGLRYFVFREGVFGADFSFNEQSLIDRYDSELQGAMGNLVSRALTLVAKHSDSKIPDFESYRLFDVAELNRKFQEELASFNIHIALEQVHFQLTEVNKWLTEKAPWHMKEDQHEEKLKVVRSTLEAVWIIAHFLAPVVPAAMEKVFLYFNTPAKTLRTLGTEWNNLKPGTVVTNGEHIFPRIQENRHTRRQQQTAQAAVAKPVAGKGKAAAEPTALDAAKLDLRVGVILSCKPHPTDGGRLYVEQIDVGEKEPRTVVSGLAQYIPLEQMQGERVIVVCNMKPSKIRGVQSEAMVLAANSEDGKTVKLVMPPPGAPAGERIAVEGYNKTDDPRPSVLNPKKKEWEAIKPDLRTDAQGVACYKGIPLTTTTGALTCTDLPSSQLG